MKRVEAPVAGGAEVAEAKVLGIKTQDTMPFKAWKAGKRIASCEMCDKEPVHITMPLLIHAKVIAMNKAVGNLEWLAYLMGKKVDDQHVTITDIVVPEQEVTAGSVDVTKPEVGAHSIGTVHLHPMGGSEFLSSIDDEFIGGNHLVEMSINKDGLYAAKSKRILPCGASILVPAQVHIDLGFGTQAADFVDVGIAKIQKVVYVQKDEPAAATPAKPWVVGHTHVHEPPASSYANRFVCTWCHRWLPNEQKRNLQGMTVCESCYNKDTP